MLMGTQMLLGAALLSAPASGSPGIHLAGRPTTFDYYVSPQQTAGWAEAVIRRVDKRGGMLTVRSKATTQTILTFPADRADVSAHRVGDHIKIQVRHDAGGIQVRHLDR